jgi:hypothetical protein
MEEVTRPFESQNLAEGLVVVFRVYRIVTGRPLILSPGSEPHLYLAGAKEARSHNVPPDGLYHTLLVVVT